MCNYIVTFIVCERKKKLTSASKYRIFKSPNIGALFKNPISVVLYQIIL